MRSIRNFLTDRWRHEQSQRQGGKVEHVSADELGDIAVDEETRKAFDQSWALNLMSLALQRMGCEMAAKGKSGLFESLSPFLGGRRMTDGDREALSRRLDMESGNLRVALHRLRARYRAAIESEIRETVSSEEEFRAEKCYMMSLWS